MDLKEYIQKQKEKVREMPEKQYAIDKPQIHILHYNRYS